MFQKILCPTDFSPGSRQALHVAVRLATEADAELELVHTWQVPALAFTPDAAYPPNAVDEMITEEEAALRAAVKEATTLGAKRLTSRFEAGIPADRICAIADADPRADLIVMGTRGRTGFRRILLGSVAEKVIRHAPCSVLAVRERAGTDAFRHVLVPVDFSPSSRHAVSLAAELVSRDGVGITLLHALDLPVAFSGESKTPGFVEDLDRRSAKLLEAWAAELRAKVSVPVVTRTRIGSPGAQALTVLDHDLTFDLAIVGSHGRTGVARFLLGSVAEKIVRHAPCPVLVARSRAT